MDRFTAEDLRGLIGARPSAAVSLYLPTFRTGPDVRQNATRLKNALARAEDLLVERGWRRPDARELLRPAWGIQAESPLWTQPGDGLAMFVAPDLFRFYRLPIHFPDQVVVGGRFQLAPLLPLLEADGAFYVLAVSQNAIRLFQGSRYSMAELHPENLPHDLRSALNIDEYVQSLQQHASGAHRTPHTTPSPGGERGRVDSGGFLFHGQGGSGLEVRKRDELLPYFHTLDRALRQLWHNDRAPLVFAGVQYLFPLFREACQYAGLVGEAVEGNPEGWSASELHEKAWKVVQPIFERQRDEALGRYGGAAARQRGTSELHEVLLASRRGQVDTLLLAHHQQVWGEVDERTERVVVQQDGAEAQGEDLLNCAALWTLLHGGQVFTLPLGQMPDGSPAAALLRYPAPPAPSDQAPSP